MIYLTSSTPVLLVLFSYFYLTNMYEIIMKSLQKHINERLQLNKDRVRHKIIVNNIKELQDLIQKRYETYNLNECVDFNDIDVSNVNNFRYTFYGTDFKQIDISSWNVSQAEDMTYMFERLQNLVSIGDISRWDVSQVKTFEGMFDNCKKLESIGDLSNWNVSQVESFYRMFNQCENLKDIGDLSTWNVQNCKKFSFMFNGCKCLKYPNDNKWKKDPRALTAYMW